MYLNVPDSPLTGGSGGTCDQTWFWRQFTAAETCWSVVGVSWLLHNYWTGRTPPAKPLGGRVWEFTALEVRIA